MPIANDTKDSSYQSMVEGERKIYEQTEVGHLNPPAQNEFEKAKWNSNGYDQSGMK